MPRIVLAAVAILIFSGWLLGQEQVQPISGNCVPNAPLACTTLQGVALGTLVQSWDVDGPRCKEACHEPEKVARAALELRRPGHPAVVSMGEFSPDWYALCDGQCTLSGYLGTFVFTFGDSSTLPIVVGCPGISECRADD